MKLSAPLVTTRSGVTQCPWTHPTQWPWTRRHLTRYRECYLYLNSRMDSSPNAVNLHGRMKLTLHSGFVPRFCHFGLPLVCASVHSKRMLVRTLSIFILYRAPCGCERTRLLGKDPDSSSSSASGHHCCFATLGGLVAPQRNAEGQMCRPGGPVGTAQRTG